MALSLEQKKLIASFITNYRGWVALAVGFLTGLIIGFLTHSWQLLFLSAMLAGLFATSYKKGLLYGASSIVAVYAFFLLIYILTSPAIQVMNIFISLIGVANGAIIGFSFILVIGYLIGLTGGYFGAVVHSFIPWPNWE